MRERHGLDDPERQHMIGEDGMKNYMWQKFLKLKDMEGGGRNTDTATNELHGANEMRPE